MNHTAKRIALFYALMIVSSAYSMDYWNSAKTASAKLYTAATQRTRTAWRQSQCSSFEDPDTNGLFRLSVIMILAGNCGITLSHDYAIPLNYFYVMLTAIGSLTALGTKPAFDFNTLYKQLTADTISPTEIPGLKKQIMELNPEIIPSKCFKDIASLIFKKKHHCMQDFEVFKHLIDGSTSNDLKQTFLINCCLRIQDPQNLCTIVKYLLKKRVAPISPITKEIDSILYLLAREEDDAAKTIKMIFSNEQVPQEKLDFYLTMAATCNKLSATIFLLQQGAQINAYAINQHYNIEGSLTPLHVASHKANSEVIRYLLYSGADNTITTTGENPQTALELYMGDRVAGDREITDMLRSNKRPHISEHARNLELELHTDKKTKIVTFLRNREMGKRK